jgi:transitional endoplasmic reticulum ATPase
LKGYNGPYLNRIEQLSHDTAGLTLMGIEDLVQEALNGPDRTLNRETVMKLKRERLRQESEGVLEVIDPHRTLDDIGGYQSLKDRLREVIQSLMNPSDELVRSSIPMGILLIGPPGTGKSIIAESLAGESNISMAKLGDFRGMYVGQSESNLSRIFSLIESLHPVIVFIDEIDQALGKRGAASGDGGVDSRIFGKFLEFMSNTEHRGKILWVGASNFPDKIDPAMKRAGRFDLILPVLLPDDESRENIIKILLNSTLQNTDKIQNSLSETDYKHIAKLTADFSGAELQAVVGETMRRLIKEFLQNKQKLNLNLQLFEKILKVYKPPVERRKDYKKMEELAIKDVSFIDMLPATYRLMREKELKE